jgi:hypothetical protein
MPRKATRINVSPFQSLAKQVFRLSLELDMTSKVTVKANAGNFAFDGNERNEGWQTQAKNGAVLSSAVPIAYRSGVLR